MFWGIDISSLLPDTANYSGLDRILLGILGLALINLWCLIDVIGYLLSIYLVKYLDIENKYPKYKRIIQYFYNTNYIFIYLQIIYIVLIHLFIIGVTFWFYYQI